MTRHTETIYNAQDLAPKMRRLYDWCKAMTIAGHRMTVEARPERRSDAASRLMWSALGDISRQVIWHGSKLEPEEWKDVFTAAQHRQKVCPGIEGGFVVLGQRTSQMTRAEMCELTTLIHAFGDGQSVQWSPASIAQDLTEQA